jgi:NADH dehydrogenase FAD-containing subunit
MRLGAKSMLDRFSSQHRRAFRKAADLFPTLCRLLAQQAVTPHHDSLLPDAAARSRQPDRLPSRMEIIAMDDRLDYDYLIVATGARPAYFGHTPPSSQCVTRAPSRTSTPRRSSERVIGDTAYVEDPSGKPLPGSAPVAKQQGKYVAKLLRARIAGRRAPGAFRCRHAGNLATIGRTAAVVDFGFLRLTGLVAWLVWGAVHISFLVGFRNRLAVAFDWLWGTALSFTSIEAT